MSTPHDNQFTWPFPQLPIIVRDAVSGKATSELLAQVDTGAGTTLIPLPYLENIQAEVSYVSRMREHGSHSYSVRVYEVDLEVAGLLFPDVEVVGAAYSNMPLLGRNILNRLYLLIAGPEQQPAVLPSQLATRTLERVEHTLT